MRVLHLAAAVTALLWCWHAGAQGLGLPNQKSRQPVEIHADHGIEWQQDAQAYIARGNASAKQGDATIYADTLTAYYRKDAQGRSQIWRIDADGHVRITTPRQTAYGKKGVYDVVKEIFVLTGSPRMVTETDKIFATGSLEFWETKSLAVARENALVIRGDRRLRADVLTAHFVKGKDGKSEVSRIEAFNNVHISTPEEVVRGQRGVYNTRTGIIVLRGSVKITRGKDQLDGDAAEVNLNTGVSRLLNEGTGQVRGLFEPQRKRRPRSGNPSGAAGTPQRRPAPPSR